MKMTINSNEMTINSSGKARGGGGAAGGVGPEPTVGCTFGCTFGCTSVTTGVWWHGGSGKLDPSNQPRHTQGREKRRPST